jgi:hypothetical protein
MKIKTVLLSIIFVSILISLPAMLRVGYVIDWIPEATILQKFKGLVMDGLSNNYLTKVIVSTIAGIIFNIIFLMKRKVSNKS